MVIWLASYPRSGNTFMRVLLKACFGLNSYSQYNDTSDIGVDSEFAKTVGHQKYEGNWKEFYAEAKKSNERILIKTHDKPIDAGKTIYLVRDPRSVVVSFHNYLQSFSTLELKRVHTIMGATAFGAWGQHIMEWRPDKRYDTLIVHFEELVQNPLHIAQKVGDFLGIEMHGNSIPSFADLQKLNPAFFRSGSNKQNVSELNSNELNLVNFLFRKQMKIMGYEPDERNNRNDALNLVTDISKDIWTLQHDVRTRLEKNATLISEKEKKHAAEIKLVRDGQKEFVDKLVSSAQSSGAQAEALAKQSIALTEKFEKTNDQLEGLWKQRSELTATVEVLRDARAAQTEANARLATENSDLVDQVATLRSEMKKTTFDLTETNQKLEGLWKQKSELVATIEVLRSKETSLLEEMDIFKVELSKQEDLNARLAKATLANSALEAKMTEQRAEKKKLDSKLAYRDRALEKAKTELASAKVLVDARSEELLTLRSHLMTERNRIDKLQNLMMEASAQKVAREAFVRELEKDLDALRRKVSRLSQRNQELSSQYATTKEHYLEMNKAVAPRIKSILTLKPMRYVWNKRQLVKRGDLQLDSIGLPVPNSHENMRQTNLEKTDHIVSNASPKLEKRQSKPSIYSSYEIKKPLGVAVYTFDRADSVESVLESLLLQDGLENAHVWIDGDQGNPKRRKLLDETEKLVETFPVKQIHRNRGNYGFRKMMIVSMRKMFEMYDRVLFLEDDCFPTRHTIKGFSSELDDIENDESVFSVYGHPFLTEQEKSGPIGRFQGWGWASTRQKLMPLWPSLLDAYLMSEDEYKQYIDGALNKKILSHIDVTPGRQPSSTFTKFFAWDETLCFLAGQKGLTHKRTSERLIYNFGVGDSSTHFGNVDHYRKPPFNMVTINEIWDHF